jgi:hypothetical protein
MNKLLIAVVFALSITNAFAAPHNIDDMATTHQCSGTLSRSDAQRGNGDNLALSNPDNEGICIIAKADEPKVLRGCAVGQFCVVTGSIKLCEDAGECVEVGHVTRAKRE